MAFTLTGKISSPASRLKWSLFKTHNSKKNHILALSPASH
jgi:hypothetical protein